VEELIDASNVDPSAAFAIAVTTRIEWRGRAPAI
jgi:hypothetical protein